MAVRKLRHVGVISVATVSAVIGIIVGLIYGIIAGAVIGLVGLPAAAFEPFAIGPFVGIIGGAVGGFIGGAIFAILYNIAAHFTGGIELDLEES